MEKTTISLNPYQATGEGEVGAAGKIIGSDRKIAPSC
jgi:hypothetical protein